MSLEDARGALRELGNRERASHALRYFRTGPGEYGEGDVFLGIDAAGMHRTARQYRELPLEACEILLDSAIHEERMLALLVMVGKFEKGDATLRREVFDRYIAKTDRVNNWDLVDASAPTIAGGWLESRSRRPLRRLARSTLLWDRRIAIIATLRFIRNGELDDTFEIARLLLEDDEDLIHKAVGWMLREAGKRDRGRLEDFLREHYEAIPRTALRYAIERFPEPLRKRWLTGPVGSQ